MKEYHDMIRQCITNGNRRYVPRNDSYTQSLFGSFGGVDLQKGFPALTTKHMAFGTCATELQWFIDGNTDLKWLIENNCNIWNGDAYKAFGPAYAEHLNIPFSELTLEEFCKGVMLENPRELIMGRPLYFEEECDLGPIYGSQWRGNYWVNSMKDLPPDQLEDLVKGLIDDPQGRRHIVMAWNPSKNKDMILPPCHMGFQCYVREYGLVKFLDLMWLSRSCDLALGAPFNIMSYALLTHLIVEELRLRTDEEWEVGQLLWSIGDLHIYSEHMDGLLQQLEREPLPLPHLELNGQSLFSFNYKMVRLKNYQHHEKIPFKLKN